MRRFRRRTGGGRLAHDAPERADDPNAIGGDEVPRLWPPSPKMQILLIAGGFFLFNLLLLVILALVLYYNST